MSLRLKAILFAMTALLAQGASAARDTSIRVTLEEPVKAGTYAGISNLRGWAAGPNGIEAVEVFIDGAYAFDVPMGGLRKDVGDALPTYPDADFSGYSMAFNYKNLSTGRHELKVKAVDALGNYNETSTYFHTDKFNSVFIADSSEVNLSTADAISQIDEHSLLMYGVSIEGDEWDVTLSWDRASQGFQITEIAPASEPGIPSASVYACVTSPTENHSSSDVTVTMKNGLVLNNYSGRYWRDGTQHTVFKSTIGRWYTIEEDDAYGSEMYRLDVITEPTSCFEADYATVTDRKVNSKGQRVLVFGEDGEIAVRGGCEIDTNSPVTYYEADRFSDDVRLVDLQTAESCDVLEVTTY